MRTVLLCITAVSALWVIPSSGERHVRFVNQLKTWTEARSFCRENFVDLVTISGEEELGALSSIIDYDTMVSDIVPHRAWIGLFDDVWTWSLPEETQTEFRNWDGGEPADPGKAEFCVLMTDSGLWRDKKCGEKRKAVCTDVQGSDVVYVVVSQSMSWTEAQSHCRQNHKDLASVRNSSENESIRQVIPNGEMLWIGLSRKSWTWVDGSELTFHKWKSGEPNSPAELCVMANFESGGEWEDAPCGYRNPFFCYEVPVQESILELKVSKSSSVDLNDPSVLENLLNQFKEKLEENQKTAEIRLSWRERSDGQIFHKSK